MQESENNFICECRVRAKEKTPIHVIIINNILKSHL